MGRKSPNYHVDVDRKSESYRPGSVTSSDLSDVSSVGKKSHNAPKIVAVIIVSLAIVAILVGVTVYLIDAEKAKQKVEREERIEEGIETEIDFGENAKAYIAEHETTENLLDLSGKSDIYESLQRKLTKEQLEQLKQISQRKRFLENFQKSKQEEFLRPTEEEKEIISSLISNRKPHTANIGHRKKLPGQDLEFGGAGLFGNRHQAFPAVPHLHRGDETSENHNNEESEMVTDDNPMTMKNLIKHRDDADPIHEDIYDMSSYIAQDEVQQPMQKMNKRPGPGPRRKLRNRNNYLRLGLEGFRRNEPVEVNVEESPLDNVEMPSVDDDERPVVTRRPQMVGVGEQGPSLATIDRRPGRPTFHHQGPLGGGGGPGMRPFARRRFRQQPSGLHNVNQDQIATESFHRKMLMEMTNKKQDEILSNFDSFLKIAGSELGFLRNVAKNITQSGKEVNLWEVLTAVNETVRKNPDSSIAQLMTKFEVRHNCNTRVGCSYAILGL